MPAFQTLLSKGRSELFPKDLSACLFDLHHLQVAAALDRPVAPLSALGDGIDASSGWWLRADPVHMVADRDQLYLSASEILELSQSEADELLAEINRLYADEGWRFVAATPRRWYLQLPQPLAIRTIPTLAAMGSRVGEVLPQGDAALYWQRIMTEIQMLLHMNPVNTRRAEQGQLTVNSLWFWGGGGLPQVSRESAWCRVVADDPLALGLAQLHGVATGSPSSSSLDSLTEQGGRVLWQESVASLDEAEQRLFAPLLAGVRSAAVDELLIVLPGSGRWHIDRAALRRWWRRRRPLASLLKSEP